MALSAQLRFRVRWVVAFAAAAAGDGKGDGDAPRASADMQIQHPADETTVFDQYRADETLVFDQHPADETLVFDQHPADETMVFDRPRGQLLPGGFRWPPADPAGRLAPGALRRPPAGWLLPGGFRWPPADPAGRLIRPLAPTQTQHPLPASLHLPPRDPDQSQNLPVAGDGKGDGDLPVAGDGKGDGDLPVAGDGKGDGDLPVAGDGRADGDLLVAGDGDLLAAGDVPEAPAALQPRPELSALAGESAADVPVDVFTMAEALAFLAERTGLADEAGAREVAEELGCLPLGLAQAAAVMARERLGYGAYLERLRALPVDEYLGRVEGDPYPRGVAEAVLLSLAGVEGGDEGGLCGAVMDLVGVLSEAGVPRALLQAAGDSAVLAGSGGWETGPGGVPSVRMDAAIGRLVDASLLGLSVDGSVVSADRLVMRVVRERRIADGKLAAVAAAAVTVLASLAGAVERVREDPAAVRDLVGQITALDEHVTGHLAGFGVDGPSPCSGCACGGCGW